MARDKQDQAFPPGVMIYQDLFAVAEKNLNYTQRGILITAIMHHFSGQALPKEIDHDTMLSFQFMIPGSDYSAKNWSNKVSGAYGAFKKYCKQAGITPLSREEWFELGQPTFTEWRNSGEPK